MVNPIINIPILSEMGGIGPLKREFTVGFTTLIQDVQGW